MKKIYLNLLIILLVLTSISVGILFFARSRLDFESFVLLTTIFYQLYFLGSIPFGLIISHGLVKKDIRTIGSGNIGATNVLRSGHKLAAGLTLAFDFLKGFAPVLAARWLLTPFMASSKLLFDPTFPLVTLPFENPEYNGYFWTVTYLLPVIGHVFPFALDFKGGKGVATGLGVITAYYWPLGLVLIMVWGAVFRLTRLSSLSALISFLLAPLIALCMGLSSGIWFLSLLAFFILWTHRDNIARLLKGKERKIGSFDAKSK